MVRKKIMLGDTVKHKYTDLKGYVNAKTEYLNGCVQFEVIPTKLVDGKIVDGQWIDEPQLELVLPAKVKRINEPPHGGTRAHPSRR